MADTGKNYRKGDPVRGAAILMLSCELNGITGAAARMLIRDTLRDLRLAEAEVRQYLQRHRDELTALLMTQEKA
jgi:hypothetical protein